MSSFMFARVVTLEGLKHTRTRTHTYTYTHAELRFEVEMVIKLKFKKIYLRKNITEESRRLG